jgi:uncharacterized membrane protein YfcA
MELIYIATFIVACISSTLSGIAGGGGGFITPPYWLLIGMTPAQGATTGAFMSIGMSVSSLHVLKGHNQYPNNKKIKIFITLITLCTSILGALVLTRVDAHIFKVALTILTILSIPLLFIPKPNMYIAQKYSVLILTVLLVLSSIIASSAFSILITIALSQLYNLNIFESTAMRRMINLIQSVVIFIILSMQGHFLLVHSVSAILGSSIGSYMGTKYAVKKGENFAKWALVNITLISLIMLFV